MKSLLCKTVVPLPGRTATRPLLGGGRHGLKAHFEMAFHFMMCGWKFILWDKFGRGREKELDYKKSLLERLLVTDPRISFLRVYIEVS